jgi:hypothetical protein
VAALWDYAQRHRAPRPGEQVLAWRFHIDRDLDERHSCRSRAILAAWQIGHILTRPPTAWEFVASYSDLDYWQPLLTTGISAIYPRPITRSELLAMSPLVTTGGASA